MAKLYGEIQASALMTFDKSFSRANGQPLDATEVFYSKAAAEEYAATAVAYVGQKIVVIETIGEVTTVTHYGIEADNSLKELGSTSKQTDYSLSVEESSPEGYAKAYTFKQMGESIATINIPKDMVVKSGSIVTNPEGQAEGTYIELVLANADEDKLYINVGDLIEYVTGGTAEDGIVAITVDANHVVTATINDGSITMAKLHADIQASIHNHGNKTLLDMITAEKVAAWDAAQANVIESVDTTQFAIDESKKLTLLDITMDQVTDLTKVLAGKVDAVEGSRLITSDEAEKLEKLILRDDGSFDITTVVTADSVEGLDDWITGNAGTLKGLSENNLSDTLLAKLNGIAEGAEANYVKSVSDEFAVSDEGELSVNSVNVNKLTQTDGEYLILNGGASA